MSRLAKVSKIAEGRLNRTKNKRWFEANKRQMKVEPVLQISTHC